MLVISQQNLEKFLGELRGKFDFFELKKEDTLPFKKYFFPPIEETLKIEKKKIKIPETSVLRDFILYGLPFPALEALTQLDEIMEKPNKDYYYFQRREKSIVIGKVEEKIDVAPGGDIVFEKIKDDVYKVWSVTKKGKNLIKDYLKNFEEAQEKNDSLPQIPKGTSLSEWSQSMRQLLLDAELLADAVEWSRKHKIWEELAEKCLGCGICTYVCPLCYCFSIEDRIGLDGVCSRCRKWDACTLPNFSKIAGGHSFRPTLKERYYNWFYHKFVRAYREYGKSQCVGCGRCKHNCPAEIDIQEVLTKILEDYKKRI
ncbi:MAG: 4Fe-4S dicluster domain-containing protein [Patescibacteria group bacterium]